MGELTKEASAASARLIEYGVLGAVVFLLLLGIAVLLYFVIRYLMRQNESRTFWRRCAN